MQSLKFGSGVFLVVILLLAAAWWVMDFGPSEPVTVAGARVRLTPANAPMAGYFEMRNRSRNSVQLTAARSPAFGEIMIHRTVVQDGSSKMEHQHGGVMLAPGDVVSFEPGGLHLMLMDAKQSLEVGDEVPVTLELQGIAEPELEVVFTVVPVTSS